MRRVYLSRRTTLWALGLGLLTTGAFASDTLTTKTLFRIARSKNANVIHYGVVYRNGKLDLNEPFVAYWVMHAEDARREGLTFLEAQLAYGFALASKPTDAGFVVRLKAFTKRTLHVVRGPNGDYRAELSIAGTRAVLEHIFVSSDESGLTPKVRYVDLFGVALDSEQKLTERLVP